MLKLPGQAAESDASRVASERVAAAGCCEPGTFEQLKSDLELRNWALNAATSHFMITDMTRRGWPIVFVNNAVANDHGYEPDELLGKSALLLLSQENDPASLAQVNEAMCAGATLRTQLRSRRKDGSTFWVGFSLAPVRNSVSSITHYVSIGADITARLEEAENRARLQRQLLDEMQERERIAIELRLSQKLESIGRLAAGIAHEINTPVQYVGDSVRFLQSAMADLESLLELYQALIAKVAPEAISPEDMERIRRAEATASREFLASEVPKAFDRTLDGVARVAGIVRAMREFAHPDAHEQALADVNHAIETTLIVARGEYKYCATIETNLAALPEVLCNVGELNQVFLNLIVNAAHAISESGKDAATGRIEISTASEGSSVAVIIADNGCGIVAENLEKVFDPFFTTKEVGSGTGQGLAIARSIVVDKHGGTIEVSSEIGVGTRFTLNLPVNGRGPASKS